MAERSVINLQDYDISPENGFLPHEDPVKIIPFRAYIEWELVKFGKNLPDFINDNKIRTECHALHLLPEDSINKWNKKQMEYARMVYAFGASAFIHGQELPAVYVPEPLAKPLYLLSKALNKPPILSYDSYVLHNWRRKDPTKPIEVDNLEIIQGFLGTPDESWFILIHVNIEKEAAVLIKAIVDAVMAAEENNLIRLILALMAMGNTLFKMVRIFERMGEHAFPETYHNTRKWIMSYGNVVFENVKELNNEPQSERGQTGAQSSIIPSVVACLNIIHKETGMTNHLLDMQKYMPEGHRRFIKDIEARSKVREFVLTHSDSLLIEAYNHSVYGLYNFRKTHLDHATRFIHNQTTNPVGTGGTPFMEWLSQLLTETLEHIISTEWA